MGVLTIMGQLGKVFSFVNSNCFSDDISHLVLDDVESFEFRDCR